MKKNLHNPEHEAFAARLRQAMKDAGLKASATQLADSFNLRYWGEGITAHAARNWMFCVSMPKQDKLKTLSEVLNISPQDLLFGPQRVVHAVKETQLIDGMGMGRHGNAQAVFTASTRAKANGQAMGTHVIGFSTKRQPSPR